MTLVAAISYSLNSSICLVAASRLVFAVARDGVLPMSDWLSQVNENKQPRNAVKFISGFAAFLLCFILPSEVAFTSLLSAGGIPIMAAYGSIPLLRLLVTPNDFKSTSIKLGRLRKPMYVVTALFNGLLLATYISPFTFPVTPSTFNFGPVVWVAVTIGAVATWRFSSPTSWLTQDKVHQAFEGANVQESDSVEGGDAEELIEDQKAGSRE